MGHRVDVAEDSRLPSEQEEEEEEFYSADADHRRQVTMHSHTAIYSIHARTPVWRDAKPLAQPGAGVTNDVGPFMLI